MTDSLIDIAKQLMCEKHSTCDCGIASETFEKLDKAIRQHNAAPDVVERVRLRGRQDDMCEKLCELKPCACAEALAIAAMGGAVGTAERSGGSIPPLPPQTSEIRDVTVKNLLHKLNLDRPDIAELPEGGSIVCNITTLRQIAAYLRTTEPVSVSLEKCARAIATSYCEKYPDKFRMERYKHDAKAVLDAAGVKYVD